MQGVQFEATIGVVQQSAPSSAVLWTRRGIQLAVGLVAYGVAIGIMLRERPDALGLAVPGMPFGSPGMGPESQAEPYQVLLVKKDGSTSIYASYP